MGPPRVKGNPVYVTDGVWKIGQFFISLKLFLSSLCGMEETAAIGDAVAMEIVRGLHNVGTCHCDKIISGIQFTWSGDQFIAS